MASSSAAARNGVCGQTRGATSRHCSRRPRRCSPPPGWTPPVREIAERAGVGVGTVYRHFPRRADLIAAVFRREMDACADAAPILAAECEPFEALANWMQRYAAFVATKRGLAEALHSGDPAFGPLPAYFDQRLRPALRTLLKRAVASAEVRADVDADDILSAVASLCMSARDDPPGHARRWSRCFVDGLRYQAPPLMPRRLQARVKTRSRLAAIDRGRRSIQ